MSFQSGQELEKIVISYFNSKGIHCTSPKVLAKKIKGEPANPELYCYLDHVFTLLKNKHGNPVSFKILKDFEGRAECGGSSGDISINFLNMNNVYEECCISIKKNNIDVKHQRPGNLINQLGIQDPGYKKNWERLLTELYEQYSYAYIFPQLKEEDKKRVYWKINDYVGGYLKQFASSVSDQSRYLRFLTGGDTRYVLVHKTKSKNNENNNFLLFYVLAEIAPDAKICNVDIKDDIYLTLTNGFVIKMRLHNDDRAFNPNMKIKYATTILDYNKKCMECFRINKNGIIPYVETFSQKEIRDIENEKLRRIRKNATIISKLN
jgi:hypothetical protein